MTTTMKIEMKKKMFPIMKIESHVKFADHSKNAAEIKSKREKYLKLVDEVSL